MRLSIYEIREAVRGSYLVAPDDDRSFAEGITWDSREVAPGCVYLALVGERVDGHDFIEGALESGARVVLATHAVSDAAAACARCHGAAIIQVPAAEHALSLLAGAWRGHLTGRVIGLSGSTGKTTTKNLVRDVLAHAGSVVATAGNQNNELGVPKTVLNADVDTDNVVVEMGMRGKHQLESLCTWVKPVWGLLTNVGESHIELLGSREDIAQAKSELLAALPEHEGVAFANIADEYSMKACAYARVAERDVLLVGYDGSTEAEAHVESFTAKAARPVVWARDVKLDEQGRARFTLCAAGFGVRGLAGAQGLVTVPCALELRGLHNVANACAAAAVGYAAGLSLESCAAALVAAAPEKGRQGLVETAGNGAVPAGVIVMDDAYNANPDSMHAALATFAALNVAGKRVAVLGDMGELGSFSEECHRRVGSFAVAAHLDRLVCAGPLSRFIAQAALDGGMDADAVSQVETTDEAGALVASIVQPGDAVLVKASHFMEFDRIVKRLVG